MIRRLLVLLTLAGLAWTLGRMLRPGRPAGRGPRGGPAGGGQMVRDRVCNTFIPRSAALVVEVEGTPHFFCSEACRSAFVGELPA